MPTVIRRNERSWVIELLTKINKIADTNDLMIKRAGGESTVSTGRGSTMFPDVILYGNTEQSIILQGWEVKMPDVPIEDERFIKDAQRKAIALNLNSCLIWNFTYAVLYILDENNTFHIVKQWDDTSYIRTRDDVTAYREQWEALIEKIIFDLNHYFASGEFRQSSLGDAISNTTISTIVDRNKVLISDHLKNCAFRDTVLAAYIDNWWSDVKLEYEYDESDKYKAYAKSLILNWVNRIIFAHIIKYRQNAAMAVDNICYSTSPSDANDIFKTITDRCDFFNIFSPLRYNELLPDLTWQDIVELSLFLKENGIDSLDQTALQNILENSVNTVKRQINGQYTTPKTLAKLLVELTVRDWDAPIIDCCCGTGTISQVALQTKKDKSNARDAIESVWASDKYQYPLQVANISMTDADAINLSIRIFQHNALSLEVGETITITNPETGELMELSLPEFGTVVSNLPFVPFEIIPADDRNLLNNTLYTGLDGRSDLYFYIALKLFHIMKPGGMLGIITSNSWLGTNAGIKLVEELKKRYNLLQVHISGRGRWFKNADVVSTILILQKPNGKRENQTQFFLWQKHLGYFAAHSDAEHKLVNSALLGQELDGDIVKVSTYSNEQMSSLLDVNVCYNALFHKIGWLLSVTDKMIPINEVYRVFRGSRRGWDAMFYPDSGEHQIEPEYLRKVLINARRVDKLEATADADAFCCSDSIPTLEEQGKTGAIAWIAKFAQQRNGVGKPLPQVLKRTGMQWYELQENEIAEVFTMMNPDKRLFFAKFDTPSFVNQRLIGLRHRDEYPDQELNHALLNSMLTMFYIEASGFGRGLGVLDISKDSISRCFMLNPSLVLRETRDKIVAAFEQLKARQILKVSEELYQPDRERFEHLVFDSFGIDEHFEDVRSSLLSMQNSRGAARDKFQ